MSLTNADSYKNNREKRKKEAKKKKLLFRLKTALADSHCCVDLCLDRIFRISEN